MKTIIDNTSFMEWLNGLRETRGWTNSHMANLAGFSPTQIYYIEQNKRGIGTSVCDKIAKLFGLEREYVYRKAGILEVQEDVAEDIKLVTHYLQKLTSIERSVVIGMIEGVASKRLGNHRPTNGAHYMIQDVPISVLIVDDVLETRRNIKNLLADDPRIRIAGEAENGREGIRQFRKLSPDIVIMGINMPDMNGIDATKVIRKEGGKVIILTCMDDLVHMKQALQAGARDYQTKPPTPDELIASIIRLAK